MTFGSGIVYPFELASDDLAADPDLQQVIVNSNDEGSPVLVLVNFRLGGSERVLGMAIMSAV